MVISDRKAFDTEKDEEVWTKIIKVDPVSSCFESSYHVVRYYKTEDNEEYYLFEYIKADNNGLIVNNFNGSYWKAILEQFDISDDAYIYSQDIHDKSKYGIITRGETIKRNIEEYMK